MRTRHLACSVIVIAAALTLAVSRLGASPPEAAGLAMAESLDVNSETRVYLPLVLRNRGTVVPPTPTPTLEPGELPPPPALVAPANGAQLDTISPSFTIDNSAVGQSAQAQVHYSTAPDFTTEVSSRLWAPFQGTSTAPSYSNLNAGMTYYWRARSSLDGVNWGNWSAVWSFQTASGGTWPDPPALVSPPNGSTVTSRRPLLKWSAVAGATNYGVSVTWQGGGRRWFPTTAETSVFWDLDTNMTYEWSVRARNDYGWGTDSDAWTFTTPSVWSTRTRITPGLSRPFFELRGETKILHAAPDR